MIGARATIARSQPYYLDITHRLANKGDGIAALARAFGVELDAGRGARRHAERSSDVRPRGPVGGDGPGAARVQAAATATAATNEEDGVADAIMRFVRPRIGAP